MYVCLEKNANKIWIFNIYIVFSKFQYFLFWDEYFIHRIYKSHVTIVFLYITHRSLLRRNPSFRINKHKRWHGLFTIDKTVPNYFRTNEFR